MKREEYNACVSRGLKGKKFEPGQRKTEFCILAKLCSGKSKTREDAKLVCSQPKDKGTKGASDLLRIKSGRKTIKLTQDEYARICPCAER